MKYIKPMQMVQKLQFDKKSWTKQRWNEKRKSR